MWHPGMSSNDLLKPILSGRPCSIAYSNQDQYNSHKRYELNLNPLVRLDNTDMCYSPEVISHVTSTISEIMSRYDIPFDSNANSKKQIPKNLTSSQPQKTKP